MNPFILRATYRLQLNKHFRFEDAERCVPYLMRLGISTVYPSPYLRARPGSMHGYDISNHTELNPELGTSDDHLRFCSVLRDYGLGQLFDMVPNHMGILGNENLWWNDILENGAASRYAHYFDIDWYSSLKKELHEKVLLPILGNSYGECLEAGEIKMFYADGQFKIQYFDHAFPIAACTVDRLLEHVLMKYEPLGSEEADNILELKSIITAARNLPRRNELDSDRVAERYRETEVIRRRLDALVTSDAILKNCVSETVADFNGKTGISESFNLLDDLLNAQAYRLSYFRVAADEINYRRFFDVNELAALSMERPEVFADTHVLLLKFIEDGLVQGVRIDHIDGLFDPKAYLMRLRASLENAATSRALPYLVVEKILGAGESLAEDWRVNGTTGYDFLAMVNGLFVNQKNEKMFNRLYSRWSDGTPTFSEVSYRSKQKIQNISLSSELHVLAQRLDRLSEWNRRTRDFTFDGLTEALREVIACFPVYRSYADNEGLHPGDKAQIDLAVSIASVRNPHIHSSIFHFIRQTLLLNAPPTASPEYRNALLEFTRKFQQVTAPVMAKGVEDTSFYIFNRLLSLNEVGSDPGKFGIALEEFHQSMIERQRLSPTTMSASSTHDTKRGEDMRARLNVLSEMPHIFGKAITRWERINRRFATEEAGRRLPDRNLLYFIYQTLVGSWPIGLSVTGLPEYRQRISQYLQKAVREAKQFTSWINPNTVYEDAVESYLNSILDPANTPFIADFDRFLEFVAHCGMFNSLSQLTLKICAPGLPDFYQGTEFWDFSLVDPDNRRPVDFFAREERLSSLEIGFAEGRDAGSAVRKLLANKNDGTVKLFCIWRLLQLRKLQSRLFLEGDYRPIQSEGRFAENIIAFARSFGETRCIVIAPRFFVSLLEGQLELPLGTNIWQNTTIRLPPDVSAGNYESAFTKRPLKISHETEIGHLLADFPVGVFISSPM